MMNAGRWPRARVAAVIVAGHLIASAAGAQTPPAITLTLSEAISRAHGANLGHLARRFDRALAGADIDVARERPNPDVSWEGARDTPRQAISLAVPIETGSKRARRIDEGRAALDVVDADLARETADLDADVRRAFYRLVAADGRVDVATTLLEMARRAHDAARARVESGDAPRLDLVQASLALARAQNLDASVLGERTALDAELAVLIGTAPSTRIEPSADLFADGLPPDPGSAAVNVDLAAAATRVAAADAGIALARAARIPDLTVQGGLTYDAPPDFTYGWKASVAVTVPLFTTHKAALVRAEQASAQAAASQAATAADVSARLEAASARVTALGAAVKRTSSEILPAATTVADMAQASYEAGQTGMEALLQSLQTVAETRLEAVDTGLNFQLAVADLERARGTRP